MGESGIIREGVEGPRALGIKMCISHGATMPVRRSLCHGPPVPAASCPLPHGRSLSTIGQGHSAPIKTSCQHGYSCSPCVYTRAMATIPRSLRLLDLQLHYPLDTGLPAVRWPLAGWQDTSLTPAQLCMDCPGGTGMSGTELPGAPSSPQPSPVWTARIPSPSPSAT